MSISQKKTKDKVNRLNVKKVTGPDGISTKLLKLAGTTIVPSLTNVFELVATEIPITRSVENSNNLRCVQERRQTRQKQLEAQGRIQDF